MAELQKKEQELHRQNRALSEEAESEKNQLLDDLKKAKHHFLAKENSRYFDEDIEAARNDLSLVVVVMDFSRMSVGGGED